MGGLRRRRGTRGKRVEIVRLEELAGSRVEALWLDLDLDWARSGAVKASMAPWGRAWDGGIRVGVRGEGEEEARD